ncbi:MAG: hypothetical protein AUK44_00430 [Porphyromonadaceae bacterium CG2_30_38_12]|nr:MAG: hypothetical protein AUK44_00430 [Porphyromonadaceae bacterium CG2_30_38_12]
MQTLKIPFKPELESKTLAEIAANIDEFGVSEMIEQVNWIQQYPYKPLTTFTLARSKTSLFIKFRVRGNLLKASYSTDQSPVHEDSCVEFFCQLPNKDYYFNFEFNCIGTCSAKRRKSRTEAVEPFSLEELKTIQRFPSIGRRAFNEMQGIFEWELTVEIPFQLIDIDAENIPEKIRANFHKCADDTDSPHFVSWMPIHSPQPDFHRPEFFGDIYF